MGVEPTSPCDSLIPALRKVAWPVAHPTQVGWEVPVVLADQRETGASLPESHFDTDLADNFLERTALVAFSFDSRAECDPLFDRSGTSLFPFETLLVHDRHSVIVGPQASDPEFLFSTDEFLPAI